jgi:hypothetical protein
VMDLEEENRGIDWRVSSSSMDLLSSVCEWMAPFVNDIFVSQLYKSR